MFNGAVPTGEIYVALRETKYAYEGEQIMI